MYETPGSAGAAQGGGPGAEAEGVAVGAGQAQEVGAGDLPPHPPARSGTRSGSWSRQVMVITRRAG
jgi:hypothetical protein